MFVPTEVTIIPEFFMMRSFGWLDTLLPLIVPSMLVGAFGTLMMTEYFKSVPRELEEAAFIDGARSLQIFLNVFIPAARPAQDRPRHLRLLRARRAARDRCMYHHRAADL